MKNKKFKNRFLFLIAAFAMSFSAGVSLRTKEAPVKTEASAITPGLDIYLDTGVWNTDGALFQFYFFTDGGSSAWSNVMTNVSGAIYKTVVPSGTFYKMIAVRMDPDKPENDWNSKWNQTDDIEFEGSNFIKITGWGTDKSPHSKAIYADSITKPAEGIDASKVRIWLNRQGINEWGYNYVIRAGNTYYEPTNFISALTNGRWFVYYDVPTSNVKNKSLDIINIDSNKNTIGAMNTTFEPSDNSKVWYVNKYNDDWWISKGSVDGNDTVYNTFFAKVLEGYLTCSASADNGYGAFNLVDTNFLPKDGNWKMDGQLSDVTITDYAYGSDYSSTSQRTLTEVNAFHKYEALETAYNAANPVRYTDNSKVSNVNTVVVLAAMFTIATLGYAFFRKKKIA